jgi:uncharacterized protein YjbI with pentapeptide repeats
MEPNGLLEEVQVKCFNWSIVVLALVVCGMSADRRSPRFHLTKAAERHLQSTRECQGCWLRRSELAQLNLRGARLEKADLQGTDLSETDLSEAKLNGANLKRADLSIVVSLKGADLSGADLRGANVKESDLLSAILCGAILPDGRPSGC